MSMHLAHFPIGGLMLDPDASAYVQEASNLRAKAKSPELRHSGLARLRLRELAERFEQIAMLKSWAPKPARGQERAA